MFSSLPPPEHTHRTPVATVQPRSSRLRLFFGGLVLAPNEPKSNLDEMLFYVLPFCVPESVLRVFAYDFPVLAVTQATSCSITPLVSLVLLDLTSERGWALPLSGNLHKRFPFSFFSCTSDCILGRGRGQDGGGGAGLGIGVCGSVCVWGRQSPLSRVFSPR